MSGVADRLLDSAPLTKQELVALMVELARQIDVGELIPTDFYFDRHEKVGCSMMASLRMELLSGVNYKKGKKP